MNPSPQTEWLKLEWEEADRARCPKANAWNLSRNGHGGN